MKFCVVRKDLGGLRYDVYHCNSCSLLFASGESNRELMGRIYSRFFYTSGQQTVPQLPDGKLAPDAKNWPVLANALGRVDWLRAKGFSGSLLDVGAGRGYFVLAALSQFDASGIELDEDAVSFAGSIGAKVVEGNFLSHDFGGERFDVVTLWDVFSGFESPKEAIERLLELVRPGGCLVMTLPDSASLAARLGRAHWPLMIPPGNMCFYDAKSLRRLLDMPNVESYSVEYHGKAINIRFLVHKLMRALGLHKIAELRWPIPARWKLRLNLRDIMTVTISKVRG